MCGAEIIALKKTDTDTKREERKWQTTALKISLAAVLRIKQNNINKYIKRRDLANNI